MHLGHLLYCTALTFTYFVHDSAPEIYNISITAAIVCISAERHITFRRTDAM